MPLGSGAAFLAAPDDLMAHFHKPVDVAGPPETCSFAGVPDFSRSVDAAVGAAERVGLFREGRARLGREPDGTWVVVVPAWSEEVRGDRAAEAVCRAALEWVRRRGGA
jgi:hypothetical protein